jgi:hypothetical protein
VRSRVRVRVVGRLPMVDLLTEAPVELWPFGLYLAGALSLLERVDECPFRLAHGLNGG